ncbi:MAG TPA: right-handed parallel beta-helix repeat-containing protein [bacterium]|nr:right-handed parallel beta-helix repeat-containing protein [bacterium]
MKIRVFGLIIVAIMVLAILPAVAAAAPQVFIATDSESYKAGDTIEVSLAGNNEGEGMSVDVYIGLLTPDGELWTVGGIVWWSEAINPWIEGIYVPAGFTMNQKPFFSFDLPSGMPPISDPGGYSFAAVLTEPGTFNWACEASFAPFTVFSVAGVDYYVNAARGENYEWYDGSPDLPWKTITHALNSIMVSPASPATIHVAGGVYSASTNGETFPLNMKSWVSLVGDGPDVTVLDAQGASTSVIYCFEADDSIIEAFTITGGDAHWGGGIYCEGGSTTIKRNTITGNSASSGGGIYCDGGWATISDNIISGNYAYGGHGGGGIYCSYGYPTVQNNRIEGNRAYCDGGGINCEFTSWAQILGNTIRNNSASDGGGVGSYLAGMSISGNSITDNLSSWGGGIFCWSDWEVWILDNTISGNWAESGGGGIASWWMSPCVMNNQIVGNWSRRDGGGICCDFAETVSNNTIAENTAEADGGGIWCEYVIMFNNNTISGNVAGGLGGGIYSPDYGGSHITDSIIWNNGDDLENCTATYCCVRDPDEGQGNIHADPLFVSGPFGDYYLNAQSPCIDAGSRPAAEAGLSRMTTQADGTPDAWTVDMGVHYRIPTSQRPVVHIDSISPTRATQGVDTVEFIGHGTDDGGITGYEWRSNLDGPLSHEQAFIVLHAAHLTLGTHTISLLAWDDEHQRSERAFAELTILPSPFEAVYVDAQLGDDSTGSEISPFRTIAHALGCVHGAQEKPVTVNVAAGTYSTSLTGECFPLNMKNWVSLVGEGADTTRLDAEGGAYHVITCQSVDGLFIAGFTIMGGNADGFKQDDGHGGAIFCDNSSPTIRDNMIQDNSAELGAGIYCFDGSPMIHDNAIMGNSGGGICCYDSSSTIHDNTIIGNWGGGIRCYDGSALIQRNSIMDNWDDGGISCLGGSPRILENTIENNSGNSGGGIYCYDSSPTIRDNAIFHNSADWQGGGIFCTGRESSPTIQDNTITDNSADYGGGISCYMCSPTILDNTITNNMADTDGGGISCDRSSPTISNNTITGNSASHGGGISCQYEASPTIQCNRIADNSAECGNGGGISCDRSSPTISNNTITGNSASHGGGISSLGQYWLDSSPAIQGNTIAGNAANVGGGIHSLRSSPTISNNVISGNSVVGHGGGIFSNESRSIIQGNTILDNSADYGGGGGICCDTSSPTITDCIIWNNGDDLYGCNVTFCCVQNPDEGEGNIHADPLFVPGPFGDYYLHPDSPCIDAGSRSAAEAGLSRMTTQTDATPDAGTVDMGAHYPIPLDLDENRATKLNGRSRT